MFDWLENLSCPSESTWDRQAAANRAKAIQQSMAANCWFWGCVDWFFWNDSSTALQNCASVYCTNKWVGYLAPTLDGQILKCDDSHELEDGKCCKPKPICDHPIENWSCDSWYHPNDDNTCCVVDCWTPQECTNDWEIWSSESCKCVCDPNEKCCGIQLNTVVPFIWDCIEMNTDSSRWDTTSVTSVTAFPVLMQWLMKILMSAIMIFSFLLVIIAWLMMTTAGFWWSGGFTKWKTILKNVIISLILLWSSWLILSLINPNFFGG